MLKRLYQKTMGFAEHKHSLPALGTVSFIESSVFPIPPDVLMVPMILARRDRAFLIAFVATLFSVLGGLMGYLIGAIAFEQIGKPVLEMLGKSDSMADFSLRFNDFGFWVVLIAGLTPFPYKVITIMAGVTAMPLGTFIITSIIARGLRFFILAALLWRFGPSIRGFIEARLGLVLSILLALGILGFVAVRFL